MNNNIDAAWDFLLDNEIASEETLRVVANINGWSMETMEDILYAVTGNRTFEQYLGEDEDYEEEDEEDEL